MGISKDDWEELQRHLARVRREAEASIHEAIAALLRDNFGDAIKHLEAAQRGLGRLDEEGHKIY